ncbi:MAG: hypothetical protein ABW321_06700, partial [Polyangiales bacterium]
MSSHARLLCQVMQLLAAASLFAPVTIRAQGIATTPGGAVALGRAANVVGVHDFLATIQNPANLVVVPGRELGLELRAPLLRGCFEHDRDVCHEGSVAPSGNLGWAQAFDNGWGYGIGFFTPTTSPRLRIGDDTALLLERAQLTGVLQAGAGVQPRRWLRLGASVGVGFASVRSRQVAALQDQAVSTE